MPYGETKVYYDGSHYIAIPHTTRPNTRRRKPPEEVISVISSEKEPEQSGTEEDACQAGGNVPEKEEGSFAEEDSEANTKTPQEVKEQAETVSLMTRKELFDRLYRENLSLSKQERRKTIIEAMRPYFQTQEQAADYVAVQFERKRRNLICRRVRLMRKANLQNFNYFVTFTYDGERHSESSFRKKLKNCLSLFSYRHGWKYIGVWERSPKKKRLHFHGIFSIPEGTMPGELTEKNDYNFNTHRRQITVQNSYFVKRFGRNDFSKIEDRRGLGDAIAYIVKYLEKSGEKIVYSKGLPQFFISDIMDKDVVCRIGLEDKKLLLYDDFDCWDEGCLMGKVSRGTIQQMRKAN